MRVRSLRKRAAFLAPGAKSFIRRQPLAEKNFSVSAVHLFAVFFGISFCQTTGSGFFAPACGRGVPANGFAVRRILGKKFFLFDEKA